MFFFCIDTHIVDICFSFELVVNAPSLTRARFGQQPLHGSLVLPAACFY
jgi:hypothetical protein